VSEAAQTSDLPVATPGDTVDEIVVGSKRSGNGFPVRQTFLQRRADDGEPRPGPLGSLVAAGDLRALQLFLLLLTKASSAPWDAGLPAAVWARALGLPMPNSKTATSTISKTWLRLEGHGLVSRERRKRMAIVTLPEGPVRSMAARPGRRPPLVPGAQPCRAGSAPYRPLTRGRLPTAL
jgi:hypothetical protein